jgi:disulfide bond formation protein DsbB
MKQLSQRTTSFIGFIVIVALLGIVAYLQKYKGFEPCPLCILQRFALIGLGFIFLVGTVIHFKKTGNIILTLFAMLFSTIGAALAGRQVWLQHLPANQSSDCGASLDYMLQAFPWNEVLQKVLEGTSECSHIGLEFLHISLAGWSFVCFSGFILALLWQLCRLFRTQKLKIS